MLVIQKYGGATLATPEKIKQVALRIAGLKKSGHSIVAVVSAMGQTTNQLSALAHQVSANPSLRELDMLLSVGERTSMALLTMALNDLGCEAISFTGSQAGILTDQSHINANIIDVKAFRVSEALAKNKVVILAGFQGVSPITKEITTLGRGGSDTTAVAMAAYLNAEHCEILKDVDSIFTADPKTVPDAKPIRNLNFYQLLEMTTSGAKVLHYKSVEMAKNKNVKLYVGPASEQKSQGTWVDSSFISEKNIPLAMNSHSKILEVLVSDGEAKSAENIFLKSLADHQIGCPQILKSEAKKFSTKFLICGPTEILSAIERKEFSSRKMQIQNLNFCSVCLTMSTAMTADIQKQIEQKLTAENIQIADQIISPLSLNLILNHDQKNQALSILHSLITN